MWGEEECSVVSSCRTPIPSDLFPFLVIPLSLNYTLTPDTNTLENKADIHALGEDDIQLAVVIDIIFLNLRSYCSHSHQTSLILV